MDLMRFWGCAVVEFRLLGLVEAWAQEQRLAVGQPRQRLLLAALLVDAGRPVTPEALAYRVWGDTPPAGVRHSLNEYLTRIRRLLSNLDDDEVRLVRRGGVYVLDVDPGRVDLHQFRRLLDRARQRDCPDQERAELLGQALQLWRGEPLADLTGDWVEQIREGSRRQRIEAAVLWAQASLRLGHAGDVVEPLAVLVGEHPLSEQVVAVLMRALYATGRTMEGLDRYVALRKRLVDDLGTEPGADLQAVHQMLLRGEPDLEVPAPPSGSEASASPSRLALEPTQEWAAPAQLPLPVRGFTGRHSELSRLDGVLTETREHGGAVVICAVSGTAGVGKTALAVHWAHRHRDQFPDGQLYVNLRGFDPAGSVMSTADALHGFLEALAVPPQRIPADLGAQAALYRSLLAGKRMLVVLDNVREAEPVRPLLPGSPGCLVLVTSRRQLTSLVALDGADMLLLDVLTAEESRRMLAHRLGADRVAAEPDAVETIITRCARLPLALAVAAAGAATHSTTPLTEFARQLDEADRRLDALSAGDAISDVRAVFSWSYHALSPQAAQLFRLLGLHPGPDISVPAAASLAGNSRTEVRPLLAELGEAHLLAEDAIGRYTFHDLLRSYATEQVHNVESPQRRRAASHRLLDYYLHTAYAANRLQEPARDPIALEPPQPGVVPEPLADSAAAVAWFTTEHQVLLAAVDHALAAGFDTHTWQLAWTLAAYLDWRGHWHDYATIQRAAVTAAARLGEPDVQARTHRLLGDAYRMLGRLDDADEQLQQALAMAARSGDLTGQANTHNRLGNLRESQGRYTDALDHARQALELHRATGHRIGQASALNHIGWYHALLGDYQQALAHSQQALDMYQELDERSGAAATWDTLGYAHHHLGQYAEAVACYGHGVDHFRQLGDRFSESVVLDHLGDTHDAAGNHAAALTSYQQAVAILEDLGHPRADTMRAKLDDLTTPSQT